MLQEHWQTPPSLVKREDAQRISKNDMQSWRKTNYDEKRSKRSVTKINGIPYTEINVILTTVVIAFICIAIVVLGGYLERKMREARDARSEYQRATFEYIREKYENTRGAMQDFHRILSGKSDQLGNLLEEKMEVLIKIYRENLRQNAINSPYPIKLTG